MSRAIVVGVSVLVTFVAASAATAAGSTTLVAVSRPARGARLVYGSMDASAGLTKGAGTDAGAIAAEIFLADENGTTSYAVPAGAFGGGTGWMANDATHASFLNRAAPGGPTGVKRMVLMVGRHLRIVAQNLGDDSPLAFGAAPSSDLMLGCVLMNGSETATHCTRFAPADCAYTSLDGGTGWKLRCRNGVADPACGAVPPPVCGNGIRESGEQCDGGPACTASCQQMLPSCCAQTGSCVSAPLFSLQYYLMQYCLAVSPGSMPVPGGMCLADGSCASRSVDPVPVCCQQASSCFDDTPAVSTGELWFDNYYCNGGIGIGAGPYIVVNGACGPGGICVPL